MQQAVGSGPSIARIARGLGVSRRKLERHFAGDLSLVPSEAFLRLRLAYVRFLLRTTGHSVAWIAAETGFCDASHLIRLFRKRQGTSPEIWRKTTAPGEHEGGMPS